MRHAKQNGNSVVILDTAGRLAIDEQMMDEVAQIRIALQVNEVLLIADAMTGQDSVRVAEEFNARLPLSGLDPDQDGRRREGRRGPLDPSGDRYPDQVHLHRREADALEPFYPDRLAERILGMGDMLSLIEKTEATTSQATSGSDGEEAPHQPASRWRTSWRSCSRSRRWARSARSWR